MVFINNIPFPLTALDNSMRFMMLRIAQRLGTLPKYVYFPYTFSQILLAKDAENFVAENMLSWMLESIRKDPIDFLAFYSQRKQSLGSDTFFLRDIFQMWLALNG